MTDNPLNQPPSLDSYIKPTWCPGCGNFSIWLALKNALSQINTKPENIVISYDVGCSGNMADFLKLYGFHALHGRAVPPATGIKLANHDLKVIVVIGDGGGYAEGLTHLMSEMRGNHDITVLVHNNHRYSLTTGQMSPTTAKGTKTKSTPHGSIERELNPVAIALSNHATFVSRQFAVNVKDLTQTITSGVKHQGFSLIDVLQPCMVFNPEMDAKWYMEHLVNLDELGHIPDDKENAWKQSIRTDKLPVGLFWQDTSQLPYHQEDEVLKKGPLVSQPIDNIDLTPLIKHFK